MIYNLLMSIIIENLLSPRIRKHCFPRFNDGYYKDAAREAMVQVELALKEKGLVDDHVHYGVNLIKSLFDSNGKQQNIKLRIPLEENLQKHASNYFQSVFSYYRNYVAHDGRKIDDRICVRIMILASELLEMIDASSLSYSDLGGVDGLLRANVFQNKDQILQLFLRLDENYFPDGAIDGFVEEMSEEFGIGYDQIHAAIDLDLIRYQETEYVPDKVERDAVWREITPPDTMGWFEITALGNKVIQELKENK